MTAANLRRMPNFETIETTDLDQARGGEGFWSSVGSGAQYAYEGVRNFGNGFAAGATYGANGRTAQIEQYGNKQQHGFAPGVETGMMFNQALGPVDRLISTVAGAAPTGGGGGGG
jgi:hypothetical protein